MEDTALASELKRLQAMARELGARVGDEGAPDAARELCGALSASVDRAVHLATGSNGGKVRASSSRKATAAKTRMQVRVAAVHDTGPLDDGLSWRKYGQKDILGAPYPRAYFRCTHRHTQGCQATKHVQRATADPLLFDVVYCAAHTCAAQPAAAPPPLLISQAEQQQQQPVFGQELESPAATEAQIAWWPLEAETPLAFPASPGGAFDGSYLLPSSAGYDSSPTDGLGVGMEYEPQLDELFFNLSELFQP